MPGRSYSNGSEYRYGFNGKEKDPETITQDYGMRIYDERLGRFLSVDPITSSYPMLTPYQFASNRPIDGIDLDGLEYVTYTITISLGGKKGSTIVSKEAVWFNATQHNAHGNLGRGVLYKIKFVDARNNTPNGGYDMFVSRNAGAIWGKVMKEYGNYMGATGLYKVANDGLGFTKQYDYSISPVDQVDNLAYAHDKGYDALNAVGQKSLFSDWGTTPVDEAALNGWNKFLNNSKVGSVDPFNRQKVSQLERNAAWQGAQLFDYVVSNKKGEISEWMQQNYKGEAANHSNKGMYGAKDVQNNYNLFLNKYMEKNKEGNWSRKVGMWNEDKEHNFTPKTSKQLKTQ